MTAHPERLPYDVHDPSAVQANDWQAFRQLTNLVNHWERPGWTAGRRSYHWLIDCGPNFAVQQLAEQCQEIVAHPTVDPVPLDSLHLTLGRIGFTDEVQRSRVVQLGEAAASMCAELSSFDLTVGPLNGSPGALRFSVAPWTALQELHRRLGEVTRDAVGQTARFDTATFRPHLSIGYINEAVRLEALMPAVLRARELPTVTMSVGAAALVEMRREDRSYRYDVLRFVPFGAGPVG